VCAALVGALAWTACAGCDIGDAGAVGFRWRIVNKASGQIYDPGDYIAGDGSGACECNQDRCSACPGAAVGGRAWRVHTMRLVVNDPLTLAPVALDEADVTFPCRAREATTRFTVPVGHWALSLRVFDPAEPNLDQGTTPSPDVRDVERGRITNLDVIEVAVCPLPRS